MKRRIKRDLTIALWLASALVPVCIGTSVQVALAAESAADGIAPKNVYADTVSSSPGSDVTMAIRVDDAAGVAGGDLALSYDGTAMVATSVTPSDLLSGAGITLIHNLSTPGEVRISMAGASAIVSGSGTLLTVGFSIASTAPGGTYPISLQADLKDHKGADLATVSHPGAITLVEDTSVAHAGSDTTWVIPAGVGSVLVTLDGSRSLNAATYTWTGGPDPPDVVTPEVTLSETGRYVFSLVVANSQGTQSAPDSVVIQVQSEIVTQPHIELMPQDSLGFGEVHLGESKVDTLRLSNTGTTVLDVHSIVSSDPLAFPVSLAAESLEPQGSAGVPVTFVPQEIGSVEAVLTIRSSDPVDSLLTVRLAGVGTADSAFVDFQFDEGSGGVIRDSGSHGYEGTLLGPAYAADVAVPSPGNRSLEFEGKSDRVEIPHQAGLSFAGSFTVECYLKTLGDLDHYLVGKESLGNTSNYHLSFYQGRLVFKVIALGAVAEASAAAPAAGIWHHIAAVRDTDEKRLRLYVNGALVAEAQDHTTMPVTNTESVFLGNISDILQGSWMRMDELRLHARSLKQEEIQARSDRLPRPVMVLVPSDSLVFERTVGIGQRDTSEVRVRNEGVGPLYVAAIWPSQDVFEVDPDTLVVQEANSAVVQVVFAPQDVGIVEASLQFLSNDFEAPKRSLTLKARGDRLPRLVLMPPGEVAFPDTIGVGDRDFSVFRLANEGEGPAIVKEIVSSVAAFSVLDPPGIIEPGSTRAVSVDFVPTPVGPRQGVLTVRIENHDSLAVPVSGVAAAWPVLQVEQDTLRFEPTAVGDSSTAELVLWSKGQADVRVSSIYVESSTFRPMETSFQMPSGYPHEVPKRVAIVYRPTSTLVSSSVLIVRSDDPRRPNQQVVLRAEHKVPPPEVRDLEEPFIFRNKDLVAPQPGLSWTFYDQNSGHKQKAWEARIIKDPGVEDLLVWQRKAIGEEGSQSFNQGGALQWDTRYRATVRVWCTNGDSSEWASVQFRTPINSPPHVEMESPEDGETVKWDSTSVFKFSGDAYDRDQQGVQIDSLAWISSLDGVLHSGGIGAKVDFQDSVRSLTIGEHDIVLRVWDNEGDSSSAAATLTIEGLPPVARIDSVCLNDVSYFKEGLKAREGTDILSLNGVDYDQDEFGSRITRREWVAVGNGESIVLGRSRSVEVAASTLGTGQFRIYYRVRDDDGGEAADSMDVEVLEQYGQMVVLAGGDMELATHYTGPSAYAICSQILDREMLQADDFIHLNRTGLSEFWPNVPVSGHDVSSDRFHLAIFDQFKLPGILQGVPLWIFLSGHGGRGKVQLTEDESLDGSELGEWLDELNRMKVDARPGVSSQWQISQREVIVVADACFSRDFLVQVSGPGRVVVGSSTEERALVLRSYSFSEFLFDALSDPVPHKTGDRKGRNLYESFVKAKDRLKYDQAPYLDVDGDGIPLFDEEGRLVPSEESNIDTARTIYLGGPIPIGIGARPVLYGASVERGSDNTLTLKALGYEGTEGLTVFYAVLPESAVALIPSLGGPDAGILTRVPAEARGDTMVYRGEHTLESSRSRMVLFLGTNDQLKISAGLQRVWVEGGLRCDFNGDCRVDFDDFIGFAQHFGMCVGDPDYDERYDLDGDGCVDFQDFVLFASCFGKTCG